MNRFFWNHIILIMGLVNNCWALPWFHQAEDFKYEADSHQLHAADNPLNFSGIWTGQCDNQPAVDLTIKHENNQLLIAYGFMKERYILGEIKSGASSHVSAAENMNTVASWDSEHSALIFLNYNLFASPAGTLTVFFSKVSMALQEEQLTVKGQYYQTDGRMSGFKQDTLSCIYHRK